MSELSPKRVVRLRHGASRRIRRKRRPRREPVVSDRARRAATHESVRAGDDRSEASVLMGRGPDKRDRRGARLTGRRSRPVGLAVVCQCRPDARPRPSPRNVATPRQNEQRDAGSHSSLFGAAPGCGNTAAKQEARRRKGGRSTSSAEPLPGRASARGQARRGQAGDSSRPARGQASASDSREGDGWSTRSIRGKRRSARSS